MANLNANSNSCVIPNFNLTSEDEVDLIKVESAYGIPTGVSPNSDNINRLVTKITNFINQNLDKYINCNIDNVFNRVSNDAGIHNLNDIKTYESKIDNYVRFIIGIIFIMLFILPTIYFFILLNKN